MREWLYFVAIGVALASGFGIGYGAGISSTITQDCDWETLLAGFTTLIGGGLAYIGATHPFRKERHRVAEIHIHDFKIRCEGFLIFTEPGSQIFEQHIKSFDPRGRGGNSDMISALALAAHQTLPKIPESIVTPELRKQRLAVNRHLGRFGRNDTDRTLKILPDIQETRDAIFKYCKMVSDIA